MDIQTSVLIASCDRYADLWPVFMSMFRRAWPNCPFPVFLGSNHQPYTDNSVSPILVGDDLGWGKGLRDMLAQVESRYVLLLLEDYLLRTPVDTDIVMRLERQLMELDGAYLRLRPFPRPDFRLARYPLIGEIAIGAPYRCSLQAAFWRKESLLELLGVNEETAWGFELNGARRSDYNARGFYSTWSHVLDYYAAVGRGKWIPYGVALCRECGVYPDLTSRTMLTAGENVGRTATRVTYECMKLVPWKTRNVAARWFRAAALRKPRTVV